MAGIDIHAIIAEVYLIVKVYVSCQMKWEREIIMPKYLNIQNPGVEWTKAPGTVAGATWNPTAGCHHQRCHWIMPGGVKISCYAEGIAKRFQSDKIYPKGFRHYYWHPERLDAPMKVKEPHGIFIGSMADVFGEWVADEHIEAILDVCRVTPQHIYFVLTKNPARLADFVYPDNVWVGASLPGGVPDKSFDSKYDEMFEILEHLDNVQARVKWLSLEPLWFDVGIVLHDWLNAGYDLPIDWLVIGAGSDGNRYFQPKQYWVDELVSLGHEHDVPVFMKKHLAWSERMMQFPDVD